MPDRVDSSAVERCASATGSTARSSTGYGAPDGVDIEEPSVWRACNPASWLNDGKVLAKEFARLKARGALVEWRTYHLDQFVEHRIAAARVPSVFRHPATELF